MTLEHENASEDRWLVRNMPGFYGSTTLCAVLILWLSITGCSRSESAVPLAPAEPTASLDQAKVAPVSSSNRELLAAAIRRDGLTLSLPGADTGIPDWVGRRDDEPFPVREFLLSRQSPVDNAEPYYLLGLAHIANDLNYVFPESERDQQLARTRSIVSRCLNWNDDQESKSREEGLNDVRQLLADAAPGLELLDEAQRHSECIFIPGMEFSSVLPHAQSARLLARLAVLELYLAMSNGDFDRAVQTLERAFRLSRDLRPRGVLIVQLVSFSIDSMLIQEILDMVLPMNLTAEQCDRLLSIIQRHEEHSHDLLAEGFQMEYVMFANSLEGLRTGKLTAENLDLGKLQMGLVNYETEWKGGNKLYVDLLTYLDVPYHEVLKGSDFADKFEQMKADLKAMTKDPTILLVGFHQPIVALFMFPAYDQAREAAARLQTRLSGLQALIAVRRYHIGHGHWPPRLSDALQEAGRKDLPIDPYSGEPLMYVVINNEPRVYSVGKDQQDDGAMEDWDYGRRPGDFILRIGASQ